MPRVVIGMPVYNSETHLAAAIGSVLEQTFTDFELIISDNASTDGSAAICAAYAARDSRIRLLRNPVNLGGNPNYRKVADAARGEYFKWAASNDLLARDYLERCVAALDARPDAVLAYGATILFTEDPQRGTPYDDDMDLQDADPARRFRNAIGRMRLNNVANGVMRLAALRRSSGLPDYMGSDNVLIAELALAGKIIAVPATHFYRRMSREAATRLQSEAEIRRHHYPTERLSGFFQAWQFAAGCVRALGTVGVPLGARLRAAGYVTRVLYWLTPALAEDLGEAFRFYVRGVSPQAQCRVLTLTAAGDDYTTCFDAALRRQGVEVRAAQWSGRWLYANVRPGDVILLHWPSFLYYQPASRLQTWVDLVRFAVFLWLLRARRARIAWTAHNLYPHDGGRALLVHRIGRRIVVRLASIIGVHGGASASVVQTEFHVASAPLVLLEHGHWIGFYPNSVPRAPARARLGIPEHSYMFLFVGLCKPYKNLEYLLRSHALLQDGSLLWIVGRFQSADYYAEINRTTGQCAPSRVTIRNEFIASDDMQLYLNACDSVVLPYREVLTSGAAMLAFSFGRPVIAPRLGALQELVTEDCGILYDPVADGALTDALRAMRCRRFSDAKVLDRAQQFSWDRSAQTFRDRILQVR